MLIGGLAERGASTSECTGMQGDSTPHPETGRRRSASISTSSATGRPTTLKKSPSIAGDERRPGLLDRVAAGAAAPLAARHVLVDRRVVERAERAPPSRACPVCSPSTSSSVRPEHHVVRAAGQQRAASAPPRRRRPACRAPARRRARWCRRRAPSRPARASTERALPTAVLLGQLVRPAPADAPPGTSARRRGSRGRAASRMARRCGERDARTSVTPLRGGGRRRRSRAASSRAALSGESEPCTMFSLSTSA